MAIETIGQFKDELQRRIGRIYLRKQQIDALTAQSKTRRGGDLDEESFTMSTMKFHSVLQTMPINTCLEVKSREQLYNQLTSLDAELLSEFEDIYETCRSDFTGAMSELIDYACHAMFDSVARPLTVSYQGDIRELNHPDITPEQRSTFTGHLHDVLNQHRYLLFIFYISNTRAQIAVLNGQGVEDGHA